MCTGLEAVCFGLKKNEILTYIFFTTFYRNKQPSKYNQAVV